MSENEKIIFEKYSQYLDILIEERRSLGSSLVDWLNDEEENLKVINKLEERIKKLDSQIENMIFPNTFKKFLLTEKEGSE